MSFSRLPPPFSRHSGKPLPQPTDPRRVRNGMWFVAVMFVLLVGCTVWLSSGAGTAPNPTEAPPTEGLR